MNTPQTEPPQSRRLIIAAITVMLLLSSLDQTIVSTALPTIVADLGGLDHLSWVVTAYLLASTVVAPLYGKLGDLYGRKVMMQISVSLFLLGSMLCGQATSMTFLILARGLQGVGGGGLMVLAQTVIGDVVAPRERGKIQGIFAAVFSLSSVAGPLAGGYIVDHFSWRWIFYINLPLGIAALAAFAIAFKPRGIRTSHKIDYPGAVFLTAALAATVLFTSLGGRTFAWSSPFILTMIGISVAATIALIVTERRAAEPILPPALFRHNTFVVFSAIGFIVFATMFGAITFLPLYLQVAKGVSPTASGLELLPLMLGIVTSSVLSGRIMSKTGKYRRLPMFGTFLLTVGLTFLWQLTPETPTWMLMVMIAMVGLGMGPTMSVGTTAIQNAVPRAMLGVGTAGFQLFRQVGGAIGIALFGALFSARLTTLLGAELPPGINPASLNAAAIAALPEATRVQVIASFTAALHPIFLTSACLSALAFVLTFFLEAKPLMARIEPHNADPGH
ncbi:multidrug resistance protein 3 [mine drainage metagenome]|uniref:Multidrug resistance protein 3 n=1 Tax=mine drainage metagenome TaxID=410659 RepID=A0A1J5Q1F9_9ZZZZ